MKRTPIKRGKGFKRLKRDQADIYFSLFVRYRDNWTCQRCEKGFEVGSQGLHCSHFWGRAREATRFDPENASAHCHGCHAYFTANPELHREWKLQKIGESAYLKLRIRAESRQKKDRKLQALICKKLFEQEKARFEAAELGV